MNLSAAIYDRLAGDSTLTNMLATYEGHPAIFTAWPAPGDAPMPYIVSAGHVTDMPFDTKTTRGREVMRDVRCYDNAGGSVVTVEAIAERVRELLHRGPLSIGGFEWILSSVTGPIAADETDAYGRILTVSLKAQED